MFAQDLYAAALARERHQCVAGKESLRVMDHVYLVAVHCVRARQQLEVSKMGRHHDDPLTGVFLRDFLPVVVAIVGDAVS